MTKFDKVKKFLISEGFRKDDASAYNTPLINKVIRDTPVAPLRCSRLYYRRFLVGYIYVSIFSPANNKDKVIADAYIGGIDDIFAEDEFICADIKNMTTYLKLITEKINEIVQ